MNEDSFNADTTMPSETISQSTMQLVLDYLVEIGVITKIGEGDDALYSSRIKFPPAVELGKRGGLKGGPARAKKLSAERRKEIARQAADIRWAREKKLNADISKYGGG